MMAAEQSQKEYKTLQDVRETLKEIDKVRTAEHLNDEEIEALEKSALTLREIERVLLKMEQKILAESLSAYEDELKSLSKKIRSRVKVMNRVPKILDLTEKVLKEALNLLRITGKFLN